MLLSRKIVVVASVALVTLGGAFAIKEEVSRKFLDTRFELATIDAKQALLRNIIRVEVNGLKTALKSITRNRTAIKALAERDGEALNDELLGTFNRLSTAKVLSEIFILTPEGTVLFPDSVPADVLHGNHLVQLTLDEGKPAQALIERDGAPVIANTTLLYKGRDFVGIALLTKSFDQVALDFKSSDDSEVLVFGTAGSQQVSTFGEEDVDAAAEISDSTTDKLSESAAYYFSQTSDNRSFSNVVVPLTNGAGALIGHLVAAKDATAYLAEARRFDQIGYGAVVTLIIFFVVSLGLFLRYLFRPLARVTMAIETLADGSRDIQVDGTDRRDEIGSIWRAVAVFRDKMAEADRIQEEQRLAEERATEERRATVLSFADNFEKRIRKVVDNVSTEAEHTGEASRGMNEMMRSTGGTTERVASAAVLASGNVESIASATEELTASIEEISRQASESRSVSDDASGQAHMINERVEGLAEAAEKIGEVVTLIHDIAAQTNLLALNATIEASRAGEAGKGFAVVASEVKTLAQQTALATEEISKQVSAIQASSGDAVSGIGTIRETIDQVAQIAGAISEGIEQQLAATQAIARNVSAAASGTQDVSMQIGDVRQAVETSVQTAEQHLESAERLRETGKELHAQVEQFLHEVRAS